MLGPFSNRTSTAGEFGAGQPVVRAVPANTWELGPTDQYAKWGWFVYGGVYTAQVIREARRIGATWLAIRVGSEPNCLGCEKIDPSPDRC